MADCKLCNNTRHVFKEGVGWVRCSCWGGVRAERILRKGKFPEPLIKMIPADFKMTNPAKKTLGKAIHEKTNNFNPRCMFVFSTSLEKEKAAAIIAKYSLSKNPVLETALYISLGDLTEALFQKDKEEEPVEKEWTPEQVDILVLSIGKEITNSAHKTQLYNLLYDRILNEKFTLIISSTSKSSLRAIYSDKVDDLMKEYFDYYEC